jgi:hypothetical protein
MTAADVRGVQRNSRRKGDRNVSTDKTIKEAVNETSDSALKRGGNEEKAPTATERTGKSAGPEGGPPVETKESADSKGG